MSWWMSCSVEVTQLGQADCLACVGSGSGVCLAYNAELRCIIDQSETLCTVRKCRVAEKI